MKYVATLQAAKYFGVSTRSIYRWCDDGKLKFHLTRGGHRRIELTDINEGTITSNLNRTRETKANQLSDCVCYCRISTTKQRDDLQRQVDFMAQQFPGFRIVTDIGSGLNYKRKGLLSILEQVQNGRIRKIVVATRDRLVRFGFELFEWFFKTYNVELLVLNSTQDKSPEQELTEDLMSIIHVFSCRFNGKRRYTLNKVQEDKIKGVIGCKQETTVVQTSVQVCL